MKLKSVKEQNPQLKDEGHFDLQTIEPETFLLILLLSSLFTLFLLLLF